MTFELRRPRLCLRENSLHDSFVAQSVDGHFKKRILFLKCIGEGLAAVDSQRRIPAHGAAFFVRLGDESIVSPCPRRFLSEGKNHREHGKFPVRNRSQLFT